jgi:hypothetical protein
MMGKNGDLSRADEAFQALAREMEAVKKALGDLV